MISLMPGEMPMPTQSHDGGLEYQVTPYDYYVKEYFLAKSLIYVLRYINDEVCFEVALSEAIKLYKTKEKHIRHHVSLIKETLSKEDAVS